MYIYCTKRTFIEDNEMRSLKRRVFFARASITSCVHENREKGETRIYRARITHRPCKKMMPRTAHRDDLSRISVVMKRHPGWLFEVPRSKIVDLHCRHNAARIFLPRDFIHTMCIECRTARRNICKLAISLTIRIRTHFLEISCVRHYQLNISYCSRNIIE